MSRQRHLNRAILILLLGHSVPFSACSSSNEADEKEKDDDSISVINDCQILVPCDSARFSFSDALAAGEYTLELGLIDDQIDCTLSVEESGATSSDCDFGNYELDDEHLEVDLGDQPVTLQLTDENGCSASASVSASDYTPLSDDCGADCEGATAQLDLSECAEAWGDEVQPERPACSIGYESSNVCGEFGGFTTQIIEGCGYTWVRGLYADSQRDTIVDADDIVVFQEWNDPMSTINPLGCIGGTIPDCAALPDNTSDYWNSPAPFQGNECTDDGMGGAGGMGGAVN